jgi:molybdopterin converting factor small subunit
MITVKVYLFSTIRARIGEKELKLTLPVGSSVNDLKLVLMELYPTAAPTVRNMLSSVDQVFSGDETIIPDQAEIAFFPHVSGG